MTSQTKPLLLREPLRQFLIERGYPLTQSYFNKITLPSVNAGPPVEKWFGKRPLYDPEKALAWAESRCTTAPSKLTAA